MSMSAKICKAIICIITVYALAAALYILFLICAFAFEMREHTRTAFQLVSILILSGTVTFLWKSGIWARFSTKKWALGAVITVGFLCRLTAIYLFRGIEPITDFRNFVSNAEGFLTGTGNAVYISIFPHFAGYPALLAIVMKLTGMRLGSVWLLNLLLETGSIILLYLISKRISNVPLIAPAIYALLPSSILYTVIPCSELPFGFFMLITIFLTAMACEPDNSLKRTLLLFTAAGVTLAAANAIRPFGIVLLIAALLMILLNSVRRKVCFAAMAVAFLLMSSLVTFTISSSIDRQVSTTPVGWNLYDGLSLNGKGMWNSEDNNLFAEKYAMVQNREITANELHQFFAGKSLERIREQGTETLKLVYYKPYYMWRRDSGPLGFLNEMLKAGNAPLYSNNTMELIYGVTDGYYLLLVALFIVALAVKRNQADNLYLLLTALFCGLFTLHLVLETAERYHYFGVVIFLIMLSRLSKRKVVIGR